MNRYTMSLQSVLEFCYLYLLDWLVAFGLFAAGGIVQTFKPLHRVFVISEDYSLPEVSDDLVSSPLLLLTAIPLPIVVFVIVALVQKHQKKNFYLRDFHHAVLGYLTAIAGQILIQGMGTIYVGNIRPSFLQICQPDLNKLDPCFPGSPFLCFDTAKAKDFCTKGSEHDWDGGRRSFFSGHASLSMCCFLYYGLYMAGKLKIFHQNPVRLYKVSICFLPLLGSLLMGWSRVNDNRHFSWEIFIGFVDGALFAVLGYYAYFYSIFGPMAGIPRPFPTRKENDEEKSSAQSIPFPDVPEGKLSVKVSGV